MSSNERHSLLLCRSVCDTCEVPKHRNMLSEVKTMYLLSRIKKFLKHCEKQCVTDWMSLFGKIWQKRIRILNYSLGQPLPEICWTFFIFYSVKVSSSRKKEEEKLLSFKYCKSAEYVFPKDDFNKHSTHQNTFRTIKIFLE